MTDHRFLVGQHVILDTNPLMRGPEVVEVLRCLPSDVDGSPQYRVKVGREGYERFAREDHLSALMPAQP